MSDRRRRAFERLRKLNRIADAARDPSDRLADAEVLLRIAREVSSRSITDESIDMIRRLRARSRQEALPTAEASPVDVEGCK